MKQEKLFDLLKAAVSPCECVKAAKQELLENGFEEIDYTGNWKLVRGGSAISTREIQLRPQDEW